MKRSDEVADDYNAYKLYTSQDGKTWTLIDKSQNKKVCTRLHRTDSRRSRYIKGGKYTHSPKVESLICGYLLSNDGKRPVISRKYYFTGAG